MTMERELAQAMATVVKAATAPIVADLQAVQAALGSWDTRWNDVAALRERVAVLEVLKPIHGPAGERGATGATGERGEQGERGAQGDRGERGEQGAPGVGMSGEKGAQGERGERGERGESGLSIKGDQGERGELGADGRNGTDGVDGVGIMDAMLDRAGQLIVTLSNGQTKTVGLVVGQDGKDGTHGRDVDPLFVQDFLTKELAKWPVPKDGQDGAPGLSPDDFDWDFDPATRAMTFRFVRHGAVIAERTKPLRGMRVYKNTYQSGASYDEGDVVTYNGSEWTALAPTKERPGNGATAWKLTVKHGEQGARGPEGKPGRDGRDLTQMDQTGRKW